MKKRLHTRIVAILFAVTLGACGGGGGSGGDPGGTGANGALNDMDGSSVEGSGDGAGDDTGNGAEDSSGDDSSIGGLNGGFNGGLNEGAEDGSDDGAGGDTGQGGLEGGSNDGAGGDTSAGSGDGSDDGDTGEGSGDGSGGDVGTSDGSSTPDGSITLTASADPASAEEGSTLMLEATVDGITDEELAVHRASFRWSRVDDEPINTRPFIADSSAASTTVRLPLVDADTTLTFRVALEYRRPAQTDEAGNVLSPAVEASLEDEIEVTVLDGLPSDGSIVAAPGQPAIGVPDATLSDIELHQMGPDGTITFSGEYRIGNLREHGVWSGPAGAIALVMKSGDRIPGLPENVRFERVRAIDTVSAGELGLLVSLQGAGGGAAAVVTEAGTLRAVLRTGDAVPGGTTDGTVSAIGSIARTSRGLVIDASASREVRGVWEWAGGVFSPVTLSIAAAAQADDYPATGDGCAIVAEGLTRANARGDLVFTARLISPALLATLTGETRTGCAERAGRTVLIRYRAGAHEELVSPSQLSPGVFSSRLPGTTDQGFIVGEVLKVLADGSALVQVNLARIGPLRTEDIVAESLDAVLRIADAASIELVALDGETLPPDFVGRFENVRRAYHADPSNGSVAMLVGGRGGALILRGRGHGDQPYADPRSPGASALDYVVATSGAGPSNLPGSSFFESVGLPAIDADADVSFFGVVGDSADESVARAGVWRTDATGEITLRIGSDSPVQQAGRQIRLNAIGLQGYTGVSGIGGNPAMLFASDAGALLFEGRREDETGLLPGDALVFSPAPQ